MNLLVVNAGSSSLKFDLLAMPAEQRIWGGELQNFSKLNFSLLDYTSGQSQPLTESDYSRGAAFVLDCIQTKFPNLKIEAVAHRVVHGGSDFYQPIKIDETNLKVLSKLSELAPLHNPPALFQINLIRQLYPNLAQYAVFDTSFFQTMEPAKYLYALPPEIYFHYQLRRYGFHGISHQYIAQQVYRITGKKDLRTISCHLGSGCSVASMVGLTAVDTSFGFGPQSGLMMSTRAGDMDSDALFYLMKSMDLSPSETNSLLNKKSGLFGVSQISPNLKDLIEVYASNPKAKLAVDMYLDRVVKEIGAQISGLGGIDILTFTAGVGQRSPFSRQKICQKLEFLGLKLDLYLNQNSLEQGQAPLKISSQDSQIEVWIIPTGEQIQIAREVAKLLD